MSDNQQSTLVQDLMDRRFFQYSGTYLAISFGLVPFSELLEGRYGLENNLVEKILLFLAIMFPAIVVFICNHSRKGDDQPILPLEMAGIAERRSELSKRNDFLACTLVIWLNADSTYQYFRETRELRKPSATRKLTR